jgi:hypothetical protein
MSILSWLLRRPSKPEALQSDVKALQSDTKAIESASIALQIVESPKEKEFQSSHSIITENQPTSSLPIQNESLSLGIAAGFTGKSLKEIEYSLSRIESQMASKDWFLANFEDKTPELIEIIKELDHNNQVRYEAIQRSIDKLKGMTQILPEPLRAPLDAQISSIESNLPLTPKMEDALGIIKEAGEISYEELAKVLNLNEVSGLRGLMANMSKRTKSIERFTKGGKGWVKYVGKSDLNHLKSDLKRDEASINDEF